MPAPTKTSGSNSAFVIGSPSSVAPDRTPKRGVRKVKEAGREAGYSVTSQNQIRYVIRAIQTAWYTTQTAIMGVILKMPGSFIAAEPNGKSRAETRSWYKRVFPGAILASEVAFTRTVVLPEVCPRFIFRCSNARFLNENSNKKVLTMAQT